MVSGYGDLTGSGTNHQITRMGSRLLMAEADICRAILKSLYEYRLEYRIY
jgi:S-adenosylhomocysteine hydrolase